jgi:hypothetical protein
MKPGDTLMIEDDGEPWPGKIIRVVYHVKYTNEDTLGGRQAVFSGPSE